MPGVQISESSRIRLGGSWGPGVQVIQGQAWGCPGSRFLSPPGSGWGLPRVQVSESSRVRLGGARGPSVRVLQGHMEGAHVPGVRVLQDQIGGCPGSRCPSPSSWDRHSLSTSCVKSSQSIQSRALSRVEPLGCLSLCKSPYSAVFSAVWKAMHRHLK